jgi:AraC-like DNA-binding protein
LARGNGWSVLDVSCTAGPSDRPFEEQHSDACIAIVISGTFQYQSAAGRELMTPGSLLLGSPGQYFECGHEHGVADRCICFSYDARYFDGLIADAGVHDRSQRFQRLRLPPVRETSLLVARVTAALGGIGAPSPYRVQTLADSDWEEIGVELAAEALNLANSGAPNQPSSLAAEARVTRVVRMIDEHPEAEHALDMLAREARITRYHFLRVFQHLTGLTPHQYVRRARLRRAATRLMIDPARIVDVALDAGFGDISNFNHAFRAEFEINPMSCRRHALSAVLKTRSECL